MPNSDRHVSLCVYCDNDRGVHRRRMCRECYDEWLSTTERGVQVATWVPADMVARLDAEAKRLRKTRSAVLRMALRRHMGDL